MPYRQTTVSGFPAVALRSEAIEVVAVPAVGMRLTHLRRLRGREWLWRNEQVPLALPRVGASYAETADSGGWDECFPTVEASPIPGASPGTAPLPDHGELWSADWVSSVYEDADGTTLTGTTWGVRLPYEFQRDVTLMRGEPVVRFRYRLRHTGDAPFPWIWAAVPSFNVQPGSALELPGVRQVKIGAVRGRDDLAPDDIVSWPGAIGGDSATFVFPEQAGWAVTLFADYGTGPLVISDPRRGERLEIAVTPTEVPQVWIRLNPGGWAPAGRAAYYNLALGPCIGAPDRLEDAVLRWQTAPMLERGSERRWELAVTLPEP